MYVFGWVGLLMQASSLLHLAAAGEDTSTCTKKCDQRPHESFAAFHFLKPWKASKKTVALPKSGFTHTDSPSKIK